MSRQFEPWPKIPRLKRGMAITEKIDGTNASVAIFDVNDLGEDIGPAPLLTTGGFDIYAGSRNRWLTRETDNFGFAAWVWGNAEGLLQLGPGRHFGEWWGSGIQRGYGLPKGERRFSLFSTSRWWKAPDNKEPEADAIFAHGVGVQLAPECCHIVPVLHTGEFDTTVIDEIMDDLRQYGSYAASGFMNPEGIVVYHAASRSLFKRTFEKDAEGKGE